MLMLFKVKISSTALMKIVFIINVCLRQFLNFKFAVIQTQYKPILASTAAMQQQATIEQKQAYFRDHINPDLYDNFSEYFEAHHQGTDINSLSMPQIVQIVGKFNQEVQEKSYALRNFRYSYKEYQSKEGKDIQSNADHQQQQSEISECQSSKVVKSSAMDLLDQFLQPPTPVQPPPKQSMSTFRSSLQYPGTPQNKPDSKNASIFNEFDFWTSTMGSSNSKPNNNEVRNKSTSEYRSSKQIGVNSPPSSKNVYNISEYGLIGNINQAPNPSTNVNAHMSSNVNVGDQGRSRHATEQLKPSDFDIFIMDMAPDSSKKSSPYMKKEGPSDIYQPSNLPQGSIKLKQVKQWHEQPRGLSVTVDKSKTRSPAEVAFEDTINCYKSTVRNQLSDRDLNVYIEKHQIIERKFLAADYAMYSMKITPLNIQCKRNYEDFSKLKENLAKIFPGVHMPYLEQTSWLSGTNNDFINNQKKTLQFFVRDLLRNKQFRNSRVMEDFLTLKDHKQIKRKFEKYEQMQPLKGLEELCLLEGKVKCTINPDQKAYIDNLQKFIEKMNEMFERQQKLTESLIEQYAELMKTFKSLTTLMEEIEKQIKQFNTKVTVNVIKYLSNSARILKQTYKQQYANAKFENQINSKKILPFLKYERKNFNELNKLIQTEKKFKKAFDKRSLTQKIGVGENYMSQSAKVTKKGILEESSSLIVLKYQAGYLGFQTRSEGQRVFDELAVKTIAKWQSLGSSYLDKLTSSIEYWQNLTKIDRTKFNTQLTF